jgi:hypothetical protein
MVIFTLDLIPAQPNLNGNTEESLLAQLKALMESLRDARDRISGCSDHWHGRNFLPQGTPEAGIMRGMAETAWRLRIDVVDTMHEEALTLALQIQGGSKQPEPRSSPSRGWEFVDGGAVKADTLRNTPIPMSAGESVRSARVWAAGPEDRVMGCQHPNSAKWQRGSLVPRHVCDRGCLRQGSARKSRLGVRTGDRRR